MNPLDKFFQASPSFGFLRKTKKSTMASKDGDTPDPEEEAKEEGVARSAAEDPSCEPIQGSRCAHKHNDLFCPSDKQCSPKYHRACNYNIHDPLMNIS